MMEHEVMNENEINILDMLFILRKNLVKIIAAAVVAGILALVYTLTAVMPMYQSTTQMLIKGLDPDAMTVYADSTSRIMLVNNCIEVLKGTEVMQDVIDEMSLDMTPEQLQGCVSISSPADTQVLKISVTHYDPAEAKEIASTFAEVTHQVLAKDVGVSTLSVIQEAKTPAGPVSPNPVKNTIMGGFAGAFIVAAWVIVVRLINNKIYTPDDVERALGLTVFASIPDVAEGTSSKHTAKVPAKSKREGK